MKMKVLSTGFLGLALAMSTANAEYQQTGTSEADLETLQKAAPETDDIDTEITNARMRADSGSRSKVSMSTSLGYSGGSVKSPFGSERPNLSGDPSEETATDLGGSISARYRFTPRTSMTLGAGFGVLQPFHGANDFNVANPSLGLSRVYRIGNFQTSTSGSFTYGTSESWKAANQKASVGLSHNMMAQVGNSGFTAGASIQVVNNFQSAPAGLAPGADDNRVDWRLGFYPQLEYQFNDRYSARTVFGYFNYYSLQSNDTFKLNNAFVYQSVGIGISVTRDIYVYPNIQFIPDDLSVDNTNVAVSATLNLF